MAHHGRDLVVNRTLFEQVLESLCVPTGQLPSKSSASGEDCQHEERQQAVLELYAAGGLCHFDQGRLISLAEAAGFHRVCEVIHTARRQFDKVVACYWLDPARRQQTITYIYQVS